MTRFTILSIAISFALGFVFGLVSCPGSAAVPAALSATTDASTTDASTTDASTTDASTTDASTTPPAALEETAEAGSQARSTDEEAAQQALAASRGQVEENPMTRRRADAHGLPYHVQAKIEAAPPRRGRWFIMGKDFEGLRSKWDISRALLERLIRDPYLGLSRELNALPAEQLAALEFELISIAQSFGYSGASRREAIDTLGIASIPPATFILNGRKMDRPQKAERTHNVALYEVFADPTTELSLRLQAAGYLATLKDLRVIPGLRGFLGEHGVVDHVLLDITEEQRFEIRKLLRRLDPPLFILERRP